MKLTDELMNAMGFVDMGNHWVDAYHVMLFKDQVPSTLLELKNMLTGTAYNKGKRSTTTTRDVALDLKTLPDMMDESIIHWRKAYNRYTEAQGNG